MVVTEADSMEIHKTCKFGDHIRLGDSTNPTLHAGCMNNHCSRIVRKMQCAGCGYYDKKY